jgi:hypothetical protein
MAYGDVGWEEEKRERSAESAAAGRLLPVFLVLLPDEFCIYTGLLCY